MSNEGDREKSFMERIGPGMDRFDMKLGQLIGSLENSVRAKQEVQEAWAEIEALCESHGRTLSKGECQQVKQIIGFDAMEQATQHLGILRDQYFKQLAGKLKGGKG